jgi:hypothetical protein
MIGGRFLGLVGLVAEVFADVACFGFERRDELHWGVFEDSISLITP